MTSSQFVDRKVYDALVLRYEEAMAELTYLRGLIPKQDDFVLLLQDKLAIAPAEAQILACMLRVQDGGVVTNERLHVASAPAYLKPRGFELESADAIVKVQISKLRKKLARLGYCGEHARAPFTCLWGRGYKLDTDFRPWLLKYLQERGVAEPVF